MQKLINSDSNPTMVASKTFDSILHMIQTSNLNFQLQLSPFSANISIKRSAIKDKSGIPISLPLNSSPFIPNADADATIEFLNSKVINLESNLDSLRCEHENALHESQAAHQKIKHLEAVKIEPNEDIEHGNALVNSLSDKVSDLSKENDSLLVKIERQGDEIQDLDRLNKKAREASDILNKKLCDAKKQFKKEKDEIRKEYKADVKAWKKELGDERRQKEKLEMKLNENPIVTVEKDFENTTFTTKTEDILDPEETLCSICVSPILNYVPKYFLSARYSPACEKCEDNSKISEDEFFLSEENMEALVIPPVTRKGFNHHPNFGAPKNPVSYHCFHTQQCIIRQPFPPPLPSLTPIVNEYSMYHMKIMAGELDWGSTCWYCMRIDCDNYGCESCLL